MTARYGLPPTDALALQPLTLTKRDNVIFLHRPVTAADPARAFQALTYELVMQKHRSGTLPPGVVEALLLGVGIEP